ncbi:MAG: sodium:proton antiporter [Clostridiales Family XIII bacterium]|jgi:CPA1 family monovalent cation:H+ antiporter|nr:sodium:proton antiporter [Clostridiales Family XIII bacterium]
MELTTFIIILLFAIVLSNLLDSAFPKLPLPIIQIACGIAIAISPIDVKLTLNPEIFMGLLIAPLLFREAEEADIFALWKVRKTVIFLVFGLVFATVVIMGFAVHKLVPVIPLAACFCLGAILGPTDAIAVSTISNRIEIDDRIMTILKGEFLINDASGVISFNFAALALVTGAFSLLHAGLEFILLCLGGLVLGLILGMVKDVGMRVLKRASIRSTAAFMIIEILTPFICFFLAEAIGLSGIIAAVTAGSRQAFRITKIEVFEAEFAIFKKSMWEMLTVTVNSFIFILLGLQLPSIVKSVADSPHYSVGFALQIGLFATGVLFAVRFVGVIAAQRNTGERWQDYLRGCLILTLSGVKGTVSLATAFALPLTVAGGKAFAQRDILLLITACAIIYSLVIATGLLPLIAKAKSPEKKNQNHILVLRDVIAEIEMTGGACVNAVVLHLKQRVRALEMEDFGSKEKKRYKELGDEFLRTELECLDEKKLSGEVTGEEYLVYFKILSLMAGVQESSIFDRYKSRLLLLLRKQNAKEREISRDAEGKVGVRRIQEIFWEDTGEILAILNEKYGEKDEAILSQILEERVDSASAVMSRAFGESLGQQLHEEYDRELQRSFDMERIILKTYVSGGRITEEEADKIRIEINMLESFAIEDVHNDVAKKLIVNRVNRNRTRMRKKLGKDVEADFKKIE